jgi:hypothetical protein
MKRWLSASTIAAMLTFPLVASAQTAVPKTDSAPTPNMNCPMMGGMGGMQKNMGTMVKEMSAMMSNAADPSMRERMQKMHDRMVDMMSNMGGMMGGGMMGKGMMGKGMMQDKPQGEADTTPSTPSVDDHESHHTDQ